jgi:hypothetical protein
VRTGAIPTGEHPKGVPLNWTHTNITLGHYNLPRANTLAYFASDGVTQKKSFIKLPPGVILIKPFFVTNAPGR